MPRPHRKYRQRRDAIVVQTAIAWWESNRPVDMNEAQHRLNPVVNTVDSAESNLAYAVAAFVESKAKSQKRKKAEA